MINAEKDKVQRAVDKVLACVDIGFTGTLVFEFYEGVPQLCKTTSTQRYGKDGNSKRLDGRTDQK